VSKVQCAREALYICQESDDHLPDITDVSGRLLLLRIGSALEIQIPRQFHSRGNESRTRSIVVSMSPDW